ncbi:uncharacterized protein JCM15063_000380 [Sporobolomyces koalae]|uniref:uncharacterized protein n=1 Tax=Sporobolomyces koalae TaxID=500713 RepID=UPI00317386D6
MTATLSDGPILSQQDILELPRPAAPVVNPSGTRAVWPSSSFSFAHQRTTRQFNLVHLDQPAATPQVIKANLDSSEVAWLDDSTLVYFTSAATQSTPADPDTVPATRVYAFDIESHEEYLLGQFPVPLDHLSTHLVPPEHGHDHADPTALLAFSAVVFTESDSSLYSYPREHAEYLARQAGSDVRVYDRTFVRHWDEWTPTAGQQRQVFVVRLSKNPRDFATSHPDSDDEEGFEKVDPNEGKWAFESEPSSSSSDLNNANEGHSRPKLLAPMRGTQLECPVGPFGSASDYSLSSSSLAIHAKDPHVSPSWHTRTNVYLLSLSPKSESDQHPRMISVGTQGASSSPVFSHDGNRLAWLEMRQDGYEADRNRVMLYHVESHQRTGLTESWDSSPSSLEWTRNDQALLATTQERGHVVLYQLGLEDQTHASKTKLTEEHSVTSVSPLPGARALVSINSFTSPNELYLLSLPNGDKHDKLETASKDTKPTLKRIASLTDKLLSNKTLSRGEEFLFLGSEGQEVHGWILFPPSHSNHSNAGNRDQEKAHSYPLANICHGGPQSAWNDSWSTRWNLQSYTAQGYITVAINRTGSTGFGQEFCDKIQGDWGGAPFRDLVAGIEFVKKTWPEIDPERMCSLGASYGGFMQNYIQGHNDAFGFKCLVCHDGVFSLSQTYYATEELYFPEREFGGAPWESNSNYSKWSPDNFVSNWKTPQLVIHGSKDYRLVESEGLSVFNTLQRLGIPSRLMIFPSENHWVLKPQNSLKWHDEVFRWIGEWTHTSSSSK